MPFRPKNDAELEKFLNTHTKSTYDILDLYRSYDKKLLSNKALCIMLTRGVMLQISHNKLQKNYGYRQEVFNTIEEIAIEVCERISKELVDVELCVELIFSLFHVFPGGFYNARLINYIKADKDYEYNSWAGLTIGLANVSPLKVTNEDMTHACKILQGKLENQKAIKELDLTKMARLFTSICKLHKYGDWKNVVSLIEPILMNAQLSMANIFWVISGLCKANISSKEFMKHILSVLLEMGDELTSVELESMNRYIVLTDQSNEFMKRFKDFDYYYKLADISKRNLIILDISYASIGSLLNFFISAGIGEKASYFVLKRNAMQDTPQLWYSTLAEEMYGLINLGFTGKEVFQKYNPQFIKNFLAHLNDFTSFLGLEVQEVLLEADKKKQRGLCLSNSKVQLIDCISNFTKSTTEAEIQHAFYQYSLDVLEDSVKILWSYTALVWSNLSSCDIEREVSTLVLCDLVLSQSYKNPLPLSRKTLDQMAQISTFVKTFSPKQRLNFLSMSHKLDTAKDTEMIKRVVDFIKAQSNLVEGEGIYNGFYAVGRIKKTNELIIINDCTEYFWDTKKYNTLTEMRRDLLKRINQPYLELNYHEFCSSGTKYLNPQALFNYLTKHIK